MEQTDKEIEKIIGQMKCPKDFRCYNSGFEALCKAQDVGIKSFLECLEKDPGQCQFSLSFADKYYCKCPLRVYIAKELRK
jgi:hypothetical protein